MKAVPSAATLYRKSRGLRESQWGAAAQSPPCSSPLGSKRGWQSLRHSSLSSPPFSAICWLLLLPLAETGSPDSRDLLLATPIIRLLHLPFPLLSFFSFAPVPKIPAGAGAQRTERGLRRLRWRLDKQTYDLPEKLDASFGTNDLGGRRGRVITRKGLHKFLDCTRKVKQETVG